MDGKSVSLVGVKLSVTKAGGVLGQVVAPNSTKDGVLGQIVVSNWAGIRHSVLPKRVFYGKQ